MISLLYCIFGRGQLVEYALAGAADLFIEGMLFIAWLNALGLIK